MSIWLLLLYLPAYVYSWRKIIRTCNNAQTIHNVYDLALAILIATLASLILPIYFLTYKSISTLDAKLNTEAAKFARSLGGESPEARENRLASERLARANWVAEQERKLGIGQ